MCPSNCVEPYSVLLSDDCLLVLSGDAALDCDGLTLSHFWTTGVTGNECCSVPLVAVTTRL